ncbi:hypothetical protein J6590_014763 [Homalodisca vitripennis]|nr:hypothetical protein J6590_014762 [Homalodisca vitripennis]KAG8259294.1 hypothetical protein J6590_014763 [Homalodisca vitripennis]
MSVASSGARTAAGATRTSALCRSTLVASVDAGGKFRCENCGRCYTHKRSLSLHSRYESGKDPQFPCQ